MLAPDAIHASATHASAQSLKIQLHPAELGMVTATLRFAGEQLSIELQVENHEAYRRLSSDSETIVNSLRDLGYDIERVTVLQPSTCIASEPRAPTPAHRCPLRRVAPADQFGSGTAGGGNGGSGGRQPGRMAEMQAETASRMPLPQGEQARATASTSRAAHRLVAAALQPGTFRSTSDLSADRHALPARSAHPN